MTFESVVLLLIAFIASIISGVAGFGGSTLLTPVLTLFKGAEIAVPMLTICMLFSNLARVIIGYTKIDWKSVGWFLLPAVPLSALGAFGFTILPKDIVTRVIGIALLLFVMLKYFKLKELKANRKTVFIGGCAVGLLSGLVGSAGPIGAAIFMSLGLSPLGYIASEAMTASVQHIVKIGIYGSLLNIPSQIWILGIVMGLVMFIGTFVAKRFISGIESKRFDKIISVFLGIVSVYMIVAG